MEVSKISVEGKTFDLNYLNKTKKTNLRRKLIVEYIQSKPAGEYIKVSQLQNIGRFSTGANAHAFVKRMIRDGVIMAHHGEKPRSVYYSVLGAIRTNKELAPTATAPTAKSGPDINGFVADMQKLGVKFTITISNEGGRNE